MNRDPENTAADVSTAKQELSAFLFVTVILAPILAVVLVGGYGFSVWISQILGGPPGS